METVILKAVPKTNGNVQVLYNDKFLAEFKEFGDADMFIYYYRKENSWKKNYIVKYPENRKDDK